VSVGSHGAARGSIRGVRDAIAAIDRDIMALVAERLRLARSVAELKRESSVVTYAPEQEAAVYRRLLEASVDPGVPHEAALAIARELISAAISVQGPLTVGYVGDVYDCAWVATRRAFGACARLRRLSRVAELSPMVLRGDLDYAVARLDVPLLDAVTAAGLRICRATDLAAGERYVVVGNHLAGRSGDDTTLSHLVDMDGALRQSPEVRARWTLTDGSTVVERAGHPEDGPLAGVPIGAWPGFPSEAGDAVERRG